MSEIDLLILGLGNVLYGDDGLGVIAIDLLEQRYDIPEGAHVADGGTLGLSLLPLLQQSRQVLIVDAIRCPGRAPGNLVRLRGDEVAPAVRDRLSPHQVGVADLLDAAHLLGGNPSTVTLLGLVPEAMEWSVARSRSVDGGIDMLLNAIVHEVQDYGYQMVAKSAPAVRDRAVHHHARHFGM
ncbi:MAG: hydrogenase maturation protease [Gammaproteobacteria bacterium]